MREEEWKHHRQQVLTALGEGQHEVGEPAVEDRRRGLAILEDGGLPAGGVAVVRDPSEMVPRSVDPVGQEGARIGKVRIVLVAADFRLKLAVDAVGGQRVSR